MNYNQMKLITEKQLAFDYDCSLDEVRGCNNVLRTSQRNIKARPVGNGDEFLRMAVYNDKLLIMADRTIIPWLKDEYNGGGHEWLSEPAKLIKLNEKLKEYGHTIADTHHYYIPNGKCVEMESPYELRYYEGEDILQFKGDRRFGEAILFDESTPDMIAICAVDHGKILGMAGATADTELMWQVGVNITEEGKGKSLGAVLVNALKEAVLARGIVPLYATVESHIKSQKVAVRSGFEPIFYELYSRKL